MSTYSECVKEFNEAFEPKMDYLHLIMEEFNEWFIAQDTKKAPAEELKELVDLLYVAYGYAYHNKLGDIVPNDTEINKMITDSADYAKRFPKQSIWPTFVGTAYFYFITSRDFMWLYRLCQGAFAYGRHKGWPVEQAFKLVHASNMSKLENGKVLRREDGKVLKGKNYKAPDLSPCFKKKKIVKVASKQSGIKKSHNKVVIPLARL